MRILILSDQGRCPAGVWPILAKFASSMIATAAGAHVASTCVANRPDAMVIVLDDPSRIRTSALAAIFALARGEMIPTIVYTEPMLRRGSRIDTAIFDEPGIAVLDDPAALVKYLDALKTITRYRRSTDRTTFQSEPCPDGRQAE